ncbi:peptidoglycan DD-metalloendopeptidase family protein [Patescibacteria group bacterium]|nr:peptidoglycan DD-metalloendopeptidase family protein [Patescibacteria group bacterium]
MKFSKSVCCLLVGLILLSTSFTNNVFGYENQEAFDYFKDQGYIAANNYEDFRPDEPINQAEFVKLAMLASGVTEEQALNCIQDNFKRNWRFVYFRDVEKDAWFAPYICIAKESGFLKEGGKFLKPQSPISWFKGIGTIFQMLNPENLINHISSVNIKEQFADLIPDILFQDMTRIEALGVLYETLVDPIEDPIVDPLATDVEPQSESSAAVEATSEPQPEEGEEISQERKNQLATIARTQPNTGGSGGGSGGGGGGGGAATTYVCGNGVVEVAGGEMCDDGNAVTESCEYGLDSCYICNATCQYVIGETSYCGDGIIDPDNGEECDGGEGCSEQCMLDIPFEHNPVLPDENSRGLWVWSQWPVMAGNPSLQTEFINFLKAPHGNSDYAIDRIFLAGGGGFDFADPTDVQNMLDFLTLANQNNIAVEYLAGDPNWVRPEQMDRPIEKCQNIISFNLLTAETSDDFKGIHFDIEPHTLDDWEGNNGEGNDAYNDEHQSNFIQILETCKSMIIANRQQMSLTEVVPYWYQTSVGDLWVPFTAIDSPLDYIAIANFTDSEEWFINRAQNNLANTFIPLNFGVETNINLEEPEITFADEGYLFMEEVFDATLNALRSSIMFAGLAIHYYDSYVNMIEGEIEVLEPSDCYTPETPVNGPVNQSRIWPISAGMTPEEVSSTFGPRLQASQDYIYDFHRGVDIPATIGTPVYAVADGTVTTVYYEGEPDNPYPNGGTVVAVRHEDNGTYYSLYMHLSDISVVLDQVVTKGEQIALSGMSGETDFEHLHFEIRENVMDSEAEPHVNPFNYLPYSNTTNHTIEITTPELIDPANPTIQTHIVAPRDELDINNVKVSVYDAQCQLLEEKEVDFDERTNSGSDNAIENNVELSPAQFNADSADYQLDVIFSALTGSDRLLIVAETEDVTGNTVYAEATVE